ncbi:uncharacterized protein LY89DRAFT_36186 [Mollisia scopiformis]|uniref:Uncharacterized protein n=1 Tax=Mollisia scopiformis TaxID=149040 RepID=A0A194XE64_MOLSC|nr:uncharacterized protein LY89DRAFT_36186 [Mollisia scopiformis]KUJ18052.1 hypothetical protein LY89DRAFT_36186 [Mollisia scopiformis]
MLLRCPGDLKAAEVSSYNKLGRPDSTTKGISALFHIFILYPSFTSLHSLCSRLISSNIFFCSGSWFVVLPIRSLSHARWAGAISATQTQERAEKYAHQHDISSNLPVTESLFSPSTSTEPHDRPLSRYSRRANFFLLGTRMPETPFHPLPLDALACLPSRAYRIPFFFAKRV